MRTGNEGAPDHRTGTLRNEMKVGIQIASYTWPGGPEAIGPTLARIVRQADDVGFDSIWAGEHHVTPGFHFFPQLGLLQRLAAEAEGLWIGTNVTLLPLHNPIELAEEGAFLDVVSGGKLLLTHGWADTSITPETTIWYYDSVLDKMGKNQSDWMRLFMAPGMAHCGGGSGVNTFDSIGTLEKWVEKGVPPEQMMGRGAQGLTRPLCAYPQYAEYKGTGDLKDAANWACTAPATQSKAK